MASRPLVFDGHNDTLLDLLEEESGKPKRTFLERSELGHIDLPRAREGGLGGGFFAIFVPNRFRKGAPRPKRTLTADGFIMPTPHPVEQEYALQITVKMAAELFRIEAASEGGVTVVRSAKEIEQAMKKKSLAAILHCEGAEFVDPHFDALEVLAQAGLKSLGIVWSRQNIFAEGVPFSFPSAPDTGGGLTDLGKQLVKLCNQRKIMIDLSHLNEKGFWDVEKLTDVPLVATHSCAWALAHSARNLTDMQLEAVGKSGGVVGVNYHKGFLRADGAWAKKTSVTAIAHHARYIADKIGDDHVALGSDFDGASMPEDLRDAAGLPRLLDALEEAGFRGESLTKIAHGNWVRVLRETWGE